MFKKNKKSKYRNKLEQSEKSKKFFQKKKKKSKHYAKKKLFDKVNNV